MSEEDREAFDAKVLSLVLKRGKGEENATSVGDIAKVTETSGRGVRASVKRLRAGGHDIFINEYSQVYTLNTWNEYKYQRDKYARTVKSNRRMISRLSEKMDGMKKK